MLLSLLIACSPKITFEEAPIPVDDTFDRVQGTQDLQSRIERAAAYSEEHSGRAFMVLEGNEVRYEAGQNGYSLETPHHLYSGTKSFTCALYESLHQQDGLQPDQVVGLREQDITVDQLLHLTSGVAHRPFAMGWRLMRENPGEQDIYTAAIESSQKYEPGTTFEYGPSHYNLFGAFVTQTYGDPLGLLESRVFEPIGLRTAGWLRDSQGNPTLSMGAFTTVNEWAKFGVLVRDDGMFLGERVFEPGLHDCFTGSDANPAYGRTFWLNQPLGDGVDALSVMEDSGPIISNDGPSDLVIAAGHDDQRLYIIPSMDLVIVRLSDGHRKFKDHELLAPFFE